MRTLLCLTTLLACGDSQARPAADERPAPIPTAAAGQAAAVFAGGCFWCMESDFDELVGVVHTTSGYAGGHVDAPTYLQVVTETTGHQEVVHVVYDTSRLTYAQVLDYFLHHVDPTDDGGQFCDRGDSYRAVVVPQDAEQARVAREALAALDARGVLPGKVVVPVVEGQRFWAAEVYHQDFHEKNPGRYLPYRMGCGRDLRVQQVWAGG